MKEFEKMWRSKIQKNTLKNTNPNLHNEVLTIEQEDPIKYSKELIARLKDKTIDEKIKNIFCQSACHIPHSKLESAKAVYEETGSVEEARKELERSFKIDIKEYKNLSDQQVNMIIEKGWGLAGVMDGDTIIATKIPSMFHEYFNETNPLKKKYYYCHCPRVRKAFTDQDTIDSIYCNCGGGFYQDVWEYITGKEVSLDIRKSLFDQDDVCQFQISFK